MTGKRPVIENDLVWHRVKDPKNARKVVYSECWTPVGRYRLWPERGINAHYRVSYIPDGGEEIDLGHDKRRWQADQRVIGHLNGLS